MRAGLVGLATFALFWASREFKRIPRVDDGREAALAVPALPDVDEAALVRFVADKVRSPDARPTPHPGSLGIGSPFAVYVCLRREGQRLAEAWGEENAAGSGLSVALDRALAELSASDRGAVDCVELDLCYNRRQVRRGAEAPELDEIHRGVLGIEVSRRGESVRFAPTTMLARNMSFEGVAGSEAGNNADVEAVSVFDAQQFLVRLTEPPHAIAMFRGNRLVTTDELSEGFAQRLVNLMEAWMVRQLRPDGRMVYKYWPSRGEESTANNAIRQFMATLCLQRIAARRGDEELSARVAANLVYNLNQFYREDGALGFIDENGARKLGAAALAAMAIMRSPQRGEHREAELRLCRLVDGLHRGDGSFQTYHGEPQRDENQNFYPGEALLLWAEMLAEAPSAERRERFLRSFRYYRAWHRRNRNPAFVPWHTLAYAREWRRTNDDDLLQAVFEMNDWLLGMQQWESAEYPDVAGRFYDPRHPAYGPPHASSTGVYMEGLAAAYALARQVRDDARAERYHMALLRALRNVAQLQFADDVDLFYVSRPDPVLGGLRTEVYNNEIRVDNVQHVLMACLDLLQVFGPEDYRLSAGSAGQAAGGEGRARED